MNERDELRGTLANTICNASNYPRRATPSITLVTGMSLGLAKIGEPTAPGWKHAKLSAPLLLLRTGTDVADTLFDTFTVHCFFQRWCSHTVTGIDPKANHDEMEAHYRDKHYGVHLDIVEREVNGR